MKYFKFYLLGLVLFGLVVVCFNFDPSRFSFYPKCLFHSLTGFDCPGCGSQRAFFALLHGNLKQAADQNLLAVTMVPATLAGYALTRFRRAGATIPFISTSNRDQRLFKIALFMVVVAFWILRNIPVYPFTFLASN